MQEERDLPIKAWIDGELDEARARRVEAALDRSADARATLRDFERLSHVLKSATDVVVPEARAGAILGRVRDAKVVERRLVGVLRGLAFASAALIVAAVTLAFTLPSPASARELAGKSRARGERSVQGSDAVADVDGLGTFLEGEARLAALVWRDRN
jgi:anti-sigma factor RsiW